MLQHSQTKTEQGVTVKQAIIASLAFFGLYELPLAKKRLFQLLYKKKANREEFERELNFLIDEEKVFRKDDLIALKPEYFYKFASNKEELNKKWSKVKKYFWLISILPFVEHVSVINSLTFGNVHQESDIDFFVVVKNNRLYFVRTAIILIFKALGLYKNKKHIKDRFCFGFYVTKKGMNLEPVLLKGEDPLFAFWFASFAPILAKDAYEELVSANSWIKNYFPNFESSSRHQSLLPRNRLTRMIKILIELSCFIPAVLTEPIFRKIHIRHTFKLPENSWSTATTVANRDLLKLHALDPREVVKNKFLQIKKSSEEEG